MDRIYDIVVIKFSALGDVLRTTALLHGVKRNFPKSRVTWITESGAADLFKNNHLVDRCLEYGTDTPASLKKNKFDILICLDKEKEPTNLAMELNAGKKIGFGLDSLGALCPLNKEADYAYRLGVSDELKFRINRKTYQQIIYEICAFEYKNDRYILNLEESETERAKEWFRQAGINGKDFVVGINTGAGKRFANKAWTFENCTELVNMILGKTQAKVLLLGGHKEKGVNERIKSLFRERVCVSRHENTLREFAAVLKHCDVVVSGDTLAMHVGIALGRYVVALFGPTCSQEIELYGNGSKIVSDIECAPCYKKACRKKNICMSRISPKSVFEEVRKVMDDGR